MVTLLSVWKAACKDILMTETTQQSDNFDIFKESTLVMNMKVKLCSLFITQIFQYLDILLKKYIILQRDSNLKLPFSILDSVFMLSSSQIYNDESMNFIKQWNYFSRQIVSIFVASYPSIVISVFASSLCNQLKIWTSTLNNSINDANNPHEIFQLIYSQIFNNNISLILIFCDDIILTSIFDKIIVHFIIEESNYSNGSVLCVYFFIHSVVTWIIATSDEPSDFKGSHNINLGDDELVLLSKKSFISWMKQQQNDTKIWQNFIHRNSYLGGLLVWLQSKLFLPTHCSINDGDTSSNLLTKMKRFVYRMTNNFHIISSNIGNSEMTQLLINVIASSEWTQLIKWECSHLQKSTNNNMITIDDRTKSFDSILQLFIISKHLSNADKLVEAHTPSNLLSNKSVNTKNSEELNIQVIDLSAPCVLTPSPPLEIKTNLLNTLPTVMKKLWKVILTSGNDILDTLQNPHNDFRERSDVTRSSSNKRSFDEVNGSGSGSVVYLSRDVKEMISLLIKPYMRILLRSLRRLEDSISTVDFIRIIMQSLIIEVKQELECTFNAFMGRFNVSKTPFLLFIFRFILSMILKLMNPFVRKFD